MTIWKKGRQPAKTVPKPPKKFPVPRLHFSSIFVCGIELLFRSWDESFRPKSNRIESTSIFFYHRGWTVQVWGRTCPTLQKSGTEEGRKNKGENMVPRFNRFKELNVGCHLRGFKGISAPDPCHPACPKEAAERIQYLTWRPAFSGDREGARKSTFNGRM